MTGCRPNRERRASWRRSPRGATSHPTSPPPPGGRSPTPRATSSTCARRGAATESILEVRANGALAASQDFPVDELPEGGVDPRLHLGFLPVFPEPPGPVGVLRPLQPARPIVVAQDATLSHVVGVGTKEHHVEGEGNLGAKVGDRGIVVEDPDELGFLHEDLAHPVEFLIEVVHDACLGVHLERLDLKAREVHGDDDCRDDRDGLHEREQLREPDVHHGVRTTSPVHQASGMRRAEKPGLARIVCSYSRAFVSRTSRRTAPYAAPTSRPITYPATPPPSPMTSISSPSRHHDPTVIFASYQPISKSATALSRIARTAPRGTSLPTKKNGLRGMKCHTTGAVPTRNALALGAPASTGDSLSSKDIMNSSSAVGLRQIRSTISSRSASL